MSNYIRPMSFGELFRSFFGVYKKAFWLLTFFTLAFIVLYYFVDHLFWKNVYFEPRELRYFLGTVIDMLMPVFTVGPILIAVSSVILTRKVSFRESVSRGLSPSLLLKILLSSALPIIVASFVYTVYIYKYYDAMFQPLASVNIRFLNFWMLDLVFLFIYILATQFWIFFPMIVILEKKSWIQALKRSTFFLFKNIKNLTLINFLLFIFSAVLLYPSELLISRENEILGYIIVIPVITTIALTYYVLVYFETRARFENYSIDELSQELGFAPLEEMMSM